MGGGAGGTGGGSEQVGVGVRVSCSDGEFGDKVEAVRSSCGGSHFNGNGFGIFLAISLS